MFSIACILILLTAVAHTIGNLAAKSSGPAEEQVMTQMKESHQDMGMGMSPSIYDILRTLTFTMSITFFALGGIGLMLTGSKSVSSDVITRITWFYLIWNGAFTILSYGYKIPPPLISGVLIELALIAAVIPSGKREDAALSAKA
jgi:hypothetical protein